MPLNAKLNVASLRNLGNKALGSLSKYWSFLLPVLVCVYLLFGLIVFVVLQGNFNDWYAFMRNEAVVTLFTLYCVVGVLGMGAILLLKRNPKLLGASHKALVASFLVAIVVGTCVFTFLTFTATPDNYSWMNDGLVYQQMAQSFLTNHEFIVNGSYTHHFGPVYPLYLSGFYVFLPAHLGTQIADEVSFILALFVVFFITKKMYGTAPALITTGLIATFPIYIFATSRNYAEPLVLIMFTLTLFFILESLKAGKENRIIVAGLTAAIGFLIKSSFGYFFIIAGVAGFLWRFYYMRWQVFKNRNYIYAIIIFFALLLVWAARDIYHFWDGSFLNLFVAAQPSDYMYRATTYTFTMNFSGFFLELLIFGLFLVFFMMGYIWIFGDYLKKSFARIREERISCLMLSIVLALVIGLMITGVYFIYETGWMSTFAVSYFPQAQVRYFLNNFGRYSFIAIIPLSWLAYELAKK